RRLRGDVVGGRVRDLGEGVRSDDRTGTEEGDTQEGPNDDTPRRQPAVQTVEAATGVVEELLLRARASLRAARCTTPGACGRGPSVRACQGDAFHPVNWSRRREGTRNGRTSADVAQYGGPDWADPGTSDLAADPS